ncbi:Macrolide export ATP-binding/permease protein MacB [archaeon HR01]|nr:Macrolide export ATP-binding/permease protein MacB [archaeon HR01]
MKPVDIVRLAWSALKDRRLRSTLTILGIVIGPALITALNASTAGLSDSITSRLQTLGADSILVQRVGDFSFDEKVVRKIETIEGVKEVYPFLLIASGEVRSRGKSFAMDPTGTYTVLAIDMKNLGKLFPNIKLVEGYALGGLSSAVVGYSVWNPTDPDLPSIDVGTLVTVKANNPNGENTAKTYSVTGKLDKYGQALFVNPDNQIFISLEAGLQLTNRRSYSGAFVKIVDVSYSDQVVTMIQDLLGADVRVFSVSAITATVQQIVGTINLFISSVAMMSVIVAFLGIMTTMFTAVTERVREIGLVKALGFKTRDVLLSFLTEALIIGFLGGVIGVIVGAISSFGLTTLFSAPSGPTRPGSFPTGFGGGSQSIAIVPRITPELILTGIFLALIVGALAGLIPAYRAAKLEPIEALRRE